MLLSKFTFPVEFVISIGKFSFALVSANNLGTTIGPKVPDR